MIMFLIALSPFVAAPLIGWLYMGCRTEHHFTYELIELFDKYGE